MDPATATLIAAGITGAGALGGGFLAGRSSGEETKLQRKQRKMVDKLIASLEGDGPYSDLFNANDETFQKSFVEPAKAQFRNQIAPQIQQQYIANGQQGGSGLDDQLLRAGVDLDQLLNQYMASYQEGAQNRKQTAINSILGAGSGGTQDQSSGDAISQATAGYLSSPAFSDAVSGIFKNPPQQQQQVVATSAPPRKGFTPDYKTQYQKPLGDPSWSYS